MLTTMANEFLAAIKPLINNRDEVIKMLIRQMRFCGSSDDPNRESDLVYLEAMLAIFLAKDASEIFEVSDPVEQCL